MKKIAKDYLPRLKKYERHQKLLGNRNSYLKTDVDATFLRMKDDHMRNGQLKPGYNVQITTEQQFITNYTLHANPTDTRTLPSHLDHFHVLYGHHPEVVVADAGYGSVENYRDLEARGSTAYVKYNSFDQEQRRRRKDSALHHADFVYDAPGDHYTCPAGKTLAYHHSQKRRMKDGEVTQTHIYEAENCTGCARRLRCCPQKEKRRLYINERVERYRREACERLNSAPGKVYRSRRMIEAESVFGQIKHNRAFRRFRLRSMEKVTIEFGLLALAHNLAKLWAQTLLRPHLKSSSTLALAT